MVSNFVIQFLGNEIFVNRFIFIDGWSGIHIVAGVFIALLLVALIRKKFLLKVGILFSLLVIWETFEFLLYGVISPPLIATETFLDIFTDVWIALVSGLAIFLIFLKN